jgi:hypothetical protein
VDKGGPISHPQNQKACFQRQYGRGSGASGAVDRIRPMPIQPRRRVEEPTKPETGRVPVHPSAPFPGTRFSLRMLFIPVPRRARGRPGRSSAPDDPRAAGFPPACSLAFIIQNKATRRSCSARFAALGGWFTSIRHYSVPGLLTTSATPCRSDWKIGRNRLTAGWWVSCRQKLNLKGQGRCRRSMDSRHSSSQ